MNCEVTTVEDTPGAPLSPPGTVFEPPFALVDLFTSFTTGDFPNQLTTAFTTLGFTFVANLVIELFTFTVTTIEAIVPAPVNTASLFIGKLGLLTAPIGTSNANGFRFGVDVNAINAEVTTYMADFSAKLGMYFSSFICLSNTLYEITFKQPRTGYLLTGLLKLAAVLRFFCG